MDKPEESNVQEVKQMLKVRNELGWDKINNFIKWLNPEGKQDSLIVQWRLEVENLIELRDALGWGGINEFIKQQNPDGLRPSLLR